MNEGSLPIDEVKSDFCGLLLDGRPIVVTAPTGSGKSTRLPLWMSQKCGGPILVIEPRRVACRSLAAYLASSIGEEVGRTYGYRIRFTDCSQDDTAILFVTPGVALRLIQGNEWPFSAVLVDEFHERGWESDLVVTVLQKRRAMGQSIPIVITSATIDGGALASSLGGLYLQGQGRLHPVDLIYDEESSTPTTRHLENRVAKAVQEQLDKTSGDILVFLPGKGEIESCASFLSTLSISHELEIYRLHGSLPTSYLAKALSLHEGARRVFFSTNVSETSLTVPNVTAVIDSGLVRTRRHRGGRSGLVLEPIARSSMEQRAGRAGRIRPGVCHRLWSRAFQPEEVRAPAIERIELDDFLLHAAACGLPAKEWSKAPWPTKPPDFALESARNRLLELRAIDKEGEITDFGHRLLRLPLSVHQARLLVDVPRHLRSTMADLLALLQGRGRLMMKLDGLSAVDCDKVKEARKALFVDCYDEVYAELTCLRRGHVRKHHLHPSGTEEARRSAAALRLLLNCPIESAEEDKEELPARQELVQFLLSKWPEGGFVLRRRALNQRKKLKLQGRSPTKGEPWANGLLELFVLPYGRWNEGGRHLPEAGVILEHEWVSSRGNELKGLGRFFLPCTIQDLAEAKCGKEQISAPLYIDGKVVGTIERILAGVTLSREECYLEGKKLRQAVALLMMDGKLYQEVIEHILNAIFYMSLVGKCYEEEPRAFIEKRLFELGVEKMEDLELLEAHDFLFPKASLLDIDDGELDSLMNDFPRQWHYQGGAFDCLVNMREKIVDLCPADDKAKKIRDIPRLVIPPFRGFKVRLVKGSQVKTVRN